MPYVISDGSPVTPKTPIQARPTPSFPNWQTHRPTNPNDPNNQPQRCDWAQSSRQNAKLHLANQNMQKRQNKLGKTKIDTKLFQCASQIDNAPPDAAAPLPNRPNRDSEPFRAIRATPTNTPYFTKTIQNGFPRCHFGAQRFRAIPSHPGHRAARPQFHKLSTRGGGMGAKSPTSAESDMNRSNRSSIYCKHFGWPQFGIMF